MIKNNFLQQFQNQKIYEFLIKIILGFVIIHFSINSISVALTNIFSFDGALNVQVAQNLAKNFSYSSNYDGGELFPAYVQTGITVTLPVASLFKLFGETFESGLLINAIYLILLLVSIIYYLKVDLQVNIYFILLFCIWFYATPKLFIFGFGLYGEIPTLFYIILSIIFLHRIEQSGGRKFLLLLGFSLGLAFLTKTVAIIAIPSIIFYFIIKLFDKYEKKIEELIQQLLFTIVGFLIPVLSFELYRFLMLGNFQAYSSWWASQLNSIFMQAGIKSGFDDSYGFFPKILTHLDILSENIKLNLILIIVILCIVFFFMSLIIINIFYLKLENAPEKGLFYQRSSLVLFMITISYFGWWLLITPTQKAWHRRIFNGTVLLEICITIILSYLFSLISIALQKRKNQPKISIPNVLFYLISSLVMFSILYYFIISGNYLISFKPSLEKENYLETQMFMKSLPGESEFFAFDWMQAPIVSFVSKKEIKNISFNSNINNPGLKKGKYFIVDKAAKNIAREEYQNILMDYTYKLIFSNPEVNIYELINRKNPDYQSFTEFEKNNVSNNSIDFSKDNITEFTRNVYIDEVGQKGKWAQKYSGYLLFYSGEKFLEIKFWVPELSNYDIFNPKLDLYINQEYYYSVILENSGLQEILVPIRAEISNGPIEISLFFNSRAIVKNDIRELAFMIYSMNLWY